MPKKRKKQSAPPTPPTRENSSRFQFFLWICAFFFFAALFIRLDVITPWPGAESLSLDHALSNRRGDSPLSFLYYTLFGWGSAIDGSSEAIWLFPRMLSAVAMLLTGYFHVPVCGPALRAGWYRAGFASRRGLALPTLLW